MRAFPLIALITLACSPATDTASSSTASTTIANPDAPASPGRAAPIRNSGDATPGELKTFGDWTVGCDNTLRCTMASLGPELGEFPDATVAVERRAGPDGAFDIEIRAIDSEAPSSSRLKVGPLRATLTDGRLNIPTVRLVGAMADAPSMEILTTSDKPLATISLAGASAALRYIDARQGRDGTVTAAVAKGATPAAEVPAPPEAPSIRALSITPSKTPLATTLVTAIRKQSGCEAGDDLPNFGDPGTYALGDGKTLVLVPCGAGAYNYMSNMFILTGSKAEPATADFPFGFGGDGEGAGAQVVNAGIENDVLTSYAKGRGLGDCGTAQSFVWDGARLRLTEQSQMGECRGNAYFIPTWHARVVRR